MKQVLVDSSVLIDFLRRSDKTDTILFNLVSQQYQLYASIITHTELFSGKSVWEKKLARDELKKLFSGITFLSLDEAISEKSGQIKAKSEINLLDAIIGATAILTQLKLVTLNVKHFSKIKQLKLLKI